MGSMRFSRHLLRTPTPVAFSAFSANLAAYFLLLPLREEAAILIGTDKLPRLFTASLCCTLIVAPIVSQYIAASDRGVKIQRLFLMLAAIQIGFNLLLSMCAVEENISTAIEDNVISWKPLQHGRSLAYAAFYVWINLQNLVSTAAIWALCADVFSPEAGARSFGLLSAGATLGQLLGSLMSMVGVQLHRYLLTSEGLPKPGPPYWLLLVAAALLVLASHLCPPYWLLLVSAALLVLASHLCAQLASFGPSLSLFAASPPTSSSKLLAPSISNGRADASAVIVAKPTHVSPQVAAEAAEAHEGKSVQTQRPRAAPKVSQGDPYTPSPQAAAAAAEAHEGKSVQTQRPRAAPKASQGDPYTPSPQAAAAAAAAEAHEGKSVQTHRPQAAPTAPYMTRMLEGFRLITASPYLLATSDSTRAIHDSCASGVQAHCSIPKPIGPHMARKLEGFRLIAASPYLLLLCGFMLLTYMTSAILYFERAVIVSKTLKDSNSRATYFAAINSATAAIIFLLQVVATGRVMQRLGVRASLCLAPLLSVVGMLLIALRPDMSMVASVELVRKVVQYSLSRPTREVLFTVVSV
eukprot:gene16997-23273_t